MKIFLKYIISLPRYTKQGIVILNDLIACILTTWLAFMLRFDDFIKLKDINLTTLLLSVLISIPVFWAFGLYKTLFRFVGTSIFFSVLLANLIYGIIFSSIIVLYVIEGTPRSVGIIQPILLFLVIIISRFFFRNISIEISYFKKEIVKENVLIYGAGAAGRQLLASLENNQKYSVVGFIDDNPHLHNQNLHGKKIYSLQRIDYLKELYAINLVLLAIPSISKFNKNKIFSNLNKKKLAIKSLPNIVDIIDENVTISDVKDFLIDDLLDREQIKPNLDLLKKNIEFKTVLVTGAGGTIGTELSRQILKLKPEKLILFELNEFSLFKTHEELSHLYKDLEIIPLLGNILDQKKLEKIFKIFSVDTLYHAAAYKHVPLVESNISEGVRNNTLGTLTVVKSTINAKVKNVVLISSDKAVRPTNVMGASKRFAELCFQVYQNKTIFTCFSIVRFGNVLASSGSVIPKFKKQIIEGGPVTLTHKNISRYFMTVSEAAQLVIQAGALGKNSEVFVLDMGKSIKIRDMIIKMINLSGQKIKNKNNIDGDIEIEIIGLRPGEKLYEELLIGDNPQKTIHPKIKKINEPSISFDQFEKSIDELKISLDNDDSEQVKKVLSRVIRSYKSDAEIVDYIYNIQKDFKKKLSKKYDKSNIVKFN